MQPRDVQIPIFLWIATAILVHLFWGGTSHQVATVIEEKEALRGFAMGVQREVQAELRPIPIAMLESDVVSEPQSAPEEAKDDDSPQASPNQREADKAEKKDQKETLPKVTPEKPKPEEKKPPEKDKDKEPKDEPRPKAPELEDKKSPDLLAEKEPEKKAEKEPPKLELEQKKAIAVRQHVEKEDQPDNPDAKFLGDKANRVEEETQAKITSTDQDDPTPKEGAGASPEKPSEVPGNSEETHVASAFGDVDEGSALPAPPVEEPKSSHRASEPETALQTPEQKAQNARMPSHAPRSATPGQKAQEADPGMKPSPEIVAGPDGNYALGGSAVPKPRKKRLPPVKSAKPNDWFGLGSQSLTSSGINLNLSHNDAVAVVGEKQIQADRRMDRLRRRSQRAGTWKKVGLERWRSAIENYVPMVKPGNTTALNTAAAPFATYLNDIHNRIHPLFADQFLGSLSRLPASDPLNRPDLVAHAEIVLNKLDGSLVKAGIVKPSGVTAFDVSALESILQSSPFGAPPSAILSPDGNVYFHWEFYRNPDYACSTYFAHPYILKSAPTPVPAPNAPSEPAPGPLPGPRIPGNMLVPTGYSPGPSRSPIGITL